MYRKGRDKMTEIDDTAADRAEYAALNHEIYDLTRQLEAKEREFLDYMKTDVYDPFKNPTEFKWYRDDYTEILPWITMPEFSVPFEPAKVERSAIRKYYNIGGLTALFQFIGSNVIALGLILLIRSILSGINPNAAYGAVAHYMKSSSIFSAINLITFLLSNLLFAFIGLKWAKIKPSSMIKTRDFCFGAGMQYCLIGLFIWFFAAYASAGVEDIFSKYGFTTEVSDSDYGKTGIGMAVMALYSCIIAPLTEEIFFRGALMKIFSKSNQRFGIFMSAVFFGLAHGNLPQFLLAFLIGIFLGHIDMKHNSIVPSVIVHIFINTIVSILSALKGNTVALNAFTAALAVCGLAGLVLLLFFRNEDKLPVSTPAQSRRGVAIARSAVGLVAAVVIQAAYLVLLILKTKS